MSFCSGSGDAARRTVTGPWTSSSGSSALNRPPRLRPYVHPDPLRSRPSIRAGAEAAGPFVAARARRHTAGVAEDWPSSQHVERSPLPRLEDLPRAEHGYEAEHVQEAFDAFYRHLAQLDST